MTARNSRHASVKRRFGLDLQSIDRFAERRARHAAKVCGRRSFLGHLGAFLVGGMALPLLPFDRSTGAEMPKKDDRLDETKCDYWAYCGIDGILCNACGGSITQCPPGSEASKLSWVGTCRNPHDGKDYLVSYYDCCGKGLCQVEADCSRHQGERPGYRIGSFSDMNWCMANTNKGVHCSTAIIVGVADAD